MYKTLDWFGSHERVLAAHWMCCNANIIYIKEDSHTFHDNQGYNQLVVKQDKKNLWRHLHHIDVHYFNITRVAALISGRLFILTFPLSKQRYRRCVKNHTAVWIWILARALFLGVVKEDIQLSCRWYKHQAWGVQPFYKGKAHLPSVNLTWNDIIWLTEGSCRHPEIRQSPHC